MSVNSTSWSRRKAAVEAEAQEAARHSDAEDAAQREAELADLSDAELLEHFNLPDPDSLVAGDDVKAFMDTAVPERLRRRALRMLWRTNPVLANLDSLVDYGEDYTDAATVVENLSTAYQVGKGMLAHIEKMAQEAAAAAQDTAETADGDTSDEMRDPADAVEPPAPDEIALSAPAQDAPPPETDEGLMAPAPRRMAFSYPTEGA